ncbi:MAG: tRNA epoxyqueuosine(34) reductase QueG, partial [Phycisphaerales bacterium]|nr:tRNA epoxyqueuosine(34) reductase QueG [Phycisphaerales bacterium]
MPDQVGKRMLQLCRDERFALAGVCPARPSDHPEALRAWLAAGRHGSMSWLADHTDVRLDPRLLLEDARSVVMVADQYARRDGASTTHEDLPAGHGRVARYARGDDYHVIMKRRLHRICDLLREEHPEHAFRAFVDTAPILEREHAARAGLGWIGKHTLLIHPRRGSYLFLGGIITTLSLEAPVHQRVEPDRCGTCTRCIDACPTEAIVPYSVDASKCIAYLTIERREDIEPRFHEAIDDMIFGCDICQEVCPFTRRFAEAPTE